MSTTLSPDAARTMLAQRTGRLRGRTSPDGTLVLFRRGGLLNEFVRARVELIQDGPGTKVTVRTARPQAISVLFSFTLALFVLGVLVEVIERGVRHGVAEAVNWLPFLVIGPAIWTAVIGANYTSARSEAIDLRRLINEALKGAS
jgi:hypothetical protein